jgi:Zn-dependent M28 family amino/carboxypeptidase
MQSRRQLEQDQQPNAIPDFAAPQKKQRTVNPMSANGTVAVSTSAASSMPSGLGIPPAAIDAAASINPEFLRAHVRFLSHDLLEGRGTGQRGGDIAAQYIATQFALYGLKPAGDSGSYLQKINFKGIRTVGDQTTVALVPAHGQPIPLTFLEDYVAINQTATPTVDFDAPIVFVGYGVDAPEYKWDDFKNVDLHGKIMLVIVNQPNPGDGSFLGGKALTYYGRWTYKFEQAAKRGAVGVIIIHRTDLASYGWDVVHNSFGTTERAQLADDPLNTLQDAGWVTWDAAAKIFTAAGMDRDKMFASANSRNFKPVVLPVSLKGHIVSQVRSFTSNNVIAQLPGNNVAAGQPDSAVIYTGHYDHLGLGANTTGDNIYNGAADNATGSAIVMELARAWSICTVKPDHSIFFVAVTGEEQGLLGSRYFAMHPPVPAAQISLDLNYDELLPIGDVLSANVSGAERTSFWPTVQETAAAFSLELQPDNMPMAGSYYRSDHFSFARLGIPAFSVGEGSVFVGHPREWGADQERIYNEQHYHQVSDEYSPAMDFSGNARMARFGFVLGWKAAAMPAPLGWQSGDEFEKARTDSGVAK